MVNSEFYRRVIHFWFYPYCHANQPFLTLLMQCPYRARPSLRDQMSDASTFWKTKQPIALCDNGMSLTRSDRRSSKFESCNCGDTAYTITTVNSPIRLPYFLIRYRGVGLIRTVLIRTIGLIRTVFREKPLIYLFWYILLYYRLPTRKLKSNLER